VPLHSLVSQSWNQFSRTSCGYLGGLPGITAYVASGGGPFGPPTDSPITELPLPIPAEQASLCVCAGTTVPESGGLGYAAYVGLEILSSLGHFVTVSIQDGMLPGKLAVGKDTFGATFGQATAAQADAWGGLKLVADASSMTAYTRDVTNGPNAPPVMFSGLTAKLWYQDTGNPGDSTPRYRDVVVCKNNLLTFLGLPAYGSVKLTFNGGAPVVVNVDGNGDATYNCLATLFPCVVRYQTYELPAAGGKCLGDITVPKSYGGDVFSRTRPVPPKAPYSPKHITRLEVWLDPDSLTGADASAVNVWPDTAGAARDFLKLATAPILRRTLFAKPVVDFAQDVAGQALYSNAAALLSMSETVVIVLKYRTGAIPRGYFSQGYYPDGNSNFVNTGGWNLNNTGGAGVLSIYPDNAPIVGAVPDVLQCVVIDLNQLTGRMRVYRNGGALPALDRGYVIPPYHVTTTALGAAAANQPIGYAEWRGSVLIGELLIFSKVLRTADRTALFAYLRTKWGNAW
jgi:hypothetical protein